MKRLSRWALLFCLVPLLLVACKDQAQDASPVLLRVNERLVTLEEFQHVLKRVAPPEQGLNPDELMQLQQSTLRQLLDRELTLSEAARLGLSVSQEELGAVMAEHRRDYPAADFAQMLKTQGLTESEWVADLGQGLLMEKVVQQEVYDKIEVSDDEVAGYYKEHRRDFNRPRQVRARQILIANEDEGQRVLGLLRQGEPFAEVAKEYSLSPDREQGGDLGFFARGEMPAEFDKAVFGLPVGKLSDLVKSEYGYHIFLVEERRPARHLPLEEVVEEIRSVLLREKREKAHQQWLLELGNRASIDVNWSLL